MKFDSPATAFMKYNALELQLLKAFCKPPKLYKLMKTSVFTFTWILSKEAKTNID